MVRGADRAQAHPALLDELTERALHALDRAGYEAGHGFRPFGRG